VGCVDWGGGGVRQTKGRCRKSSGRVVNKRASRVAVTTVRLGNRFASKRQLGYLTLGFTDLEKVSYHSSYPCRKGG
jgi:hypothetical protein